MALIKKGLLKNMSGEILYPGSSSDKILRPDETTVEAGLNDLKTNIEDFKAAIYDPETKRLYMSVMPDILQHNKGNFINEAAINEALKDSVAGDYCLNIETDTVWVYDVDTSKWIDSDQKGQVSSVNGMQGDVKLDLTKIDFATTTYNEAMDRINLSVTSTSDADGETRTYYPFYNITNGGMYGHGLAIETQGGMVISAGDGATNVITGAGLKGDFPEQLSLVSDGGAAFYLGQQDGYNSKAVITIDNTGAIQAPTTIKTPGTITGGSIVSNGAMTASGTVTAAYVKSNGSITASGNITGATMTSNGNVVVKGTLQCNNTITAGGAITSKSNITATGTVTGGSVKSNGAINATGAITSSNTITGNTVNSKGAMTASGNITAGGAITSNGNITSNNGNLYARGCLIKNTGVTKGQKPNTIQYQAALYHANTTSYADTDRLAMHETQVNTSGDVKTYFGVYKNAKGSNQWAGMGVVYPYSGNPYGWAPTADSWADSETLATTAWVRDRLTISTGNPSGGTDGDIWFKY